MYGFRKVDDCHYENDNFKRGCYHLLKNMVRRHSSKNARSSNGCTSIATSSAAMSQALVGGDANTTMSLVNSMRFDAASVYQHNPNSDHHQQLFQQHQNGSSHVESTENSANMTFNASQNKTSSSSSSTSSLHSIYQGGLSNRRDFNDSCMTSIPTSASTSGGSSDAAFNSSRNMFEESSGKQHQQNNSNHPTLPLFVAKSQQQQRPTARMDLHQPMAILNQLTRPVALGDFGQVDSAGMLANARLTEQVGQQKRESTNHTPSLQAISQAFYSLSSRGGNTSALDDDIETAMATLNANVSNNQSTLASTLYARLAALNFGSALNNHTSNNYSSIINNNTESSSFAHSQQVAAAAAVAARLYQQMHQDHSNQNGAIMSAIRTDFPMAFSNQPAPTSVPSQQSILINHGENTHEAISTDLIRGQAGLIQQRQDDIFKLANLQNNAHQAQIVARRLLQESLFRSFLRLDANQTQSPPFESSQLNQMQQEHLVEPLLRQPSHTQSSSSSPTSSHYNRDQATLVGGIPQQQSIAGGPKHTNEVAICSSISGHQSLGVSIGPDASNCTRPSHMKRLSDPGRHGYQRSQIDEQSFSSAMTDDDIEFEIEPNGSGTSSAVECKNSPTPLNSNNRATEGVDHDSVLNLVKTSRH